MKQCKNRTTEIFFEKSKFEKIIFEKKIFLVRPIGPWNNGTIEESKNFLKNENLKKFIFKKKKLKKKLFSKFF